MKTIELFIVMIAPNFLQDTVLMHAQLQRLKNTYLCIRNRAAPDMEKEFWGTLVGLMNGWIVSRDAFGKFKATIVKYNPMTRVFHSVHLARARALLKILTHQLLMSKRLCF